MRNSTIKNLRARHTWLTKALSHEITPLRSEIQAMSSMRSFCSLKVPNWFNAISLNSLKQAVNTSVLASSGIHSWTHVIELRTRVFELYTPRFEPTVVPTLPSDKEQARIALLEAHIASMAYFDIYNFLELLAKNRYGSAEEILASVELKTKTSKAKYHSFLINDKIISSKNIKIFDGGKKNG